jgi:thiamine phosphate synthase YjbQ (UPF0047 family)
MNRHETRDLEILTAIDEGRPLSQRRGNACAHLRAVGLNNGELSRGRFQSVIFAELDGPRKREITVQVMGK